MTITDEDRAAAAENCALEELRAIILAGRADHHAEPWARHRLAERERTISEMETRFWSIVDADDFANVPSDMWDALDRIARAARNRDMWKAQCEEQAALLAAIRSQP